MLQRSHLESRACSRCGLALIDPASTEAGVGPICRNKDNHLYAQTLNINFPVLSALLMGIDVNLLHEAVRERFEAMRKAAVRKTNAAVEKNGDASSAFSMNIKGADLRDQARVIDWMLSYPTDRRIKDMLIQCVKCMGFPGLAGVLSGKASTGEASLVFENGTVKLTGSRCKSGFMAMRKIVGVTLPKWGGRTYTCPATRWEAFKTVVLEFWPIFSEDMSVLDKDVAGWLATHHETTLVVVRIDSRPEATMAKLSNGVGFTVNFSCWVKGKTDGVISGIKAINYKNRSYDATTKTWTVKDMNQWAKVQAILEPVYRVIARS